MPTDPLFSSPRRRRGRVETAAERVIARWRRDGVEVDELVSSILRGFGEDVDAAEQDHANGDLSRYSVARVRAELARAYVELGPTEASTDDLAELFALPDPPADVPESSRHT